MFAAILAARLALSDVPAPAPFAQELGYVIEARLDPREHLIDGRSQVRYTNRAPAALSELYIHLLPNSWRDRFSTAAKEQAFYQDYSIRRVPAADRGYLDIEALELDGTPAQFQIIDTLLKLSLPRPLAPGATLEITLVWRSRVRRLTDGSGYSGERYEMADWYPRVAVYDAAGWHAQPAHDAGGSYADFARFDVTLVVPGNFGIAATGELVEGDAGWSEARERALAAHAGAAEQPVADSGVHVQDGASIQRRVRFVAERVNDFVWVADPGLCMEERVVAGTRLRVFYSPTGVRRWKGVALERLERAQAWLAQEVGSYPWSHLTLLQSLGDEPLVGPMLTAAADPGEAALIDAVAALWFRSVVGSNGIDAAWLSRGLKAFAARRYLIERFGATGVDPASLDFYQARLRRTSARDRVQQRALAAARLGRDEPVATTIHLFRDRSNRLPAVQDKASLFVDALEATVGAEDFARGLAAWYQSARLQNTTEEDFRAAFEAACGCALGPLFDTWLHGTRTAELSIGHIRSRPAGKHHAVEVKVRRRGELVTPVTVLLHAEDGSERRLLLAPGLREATLATEMSAPLRWVAVDPDAIALERDRLDNHRPRDFDLVFGWPYQNYTPRDAYALSLRPSLYYNAVDHLRTGLVMEGRQEELRHRLKLASSLGLSGGSFDYDVRYATPMFSVERTEVELGNLESEGRHLYYGLIRSNLSPRLERRPQARVEAGFSSLKVFDEAYLRPGRWERGRLNQVYLKLAGEAAGTYWQSGTELALQVSGKPIESDFTFAKLSVAGQIAFDREPTTLKLRAFLGLSSDGEPPPLQERFYLSGATPAEEYLHTGLRSRDSLLTYVNYHVPGNGNFRAYHNTTVSGTRLFAVNFEANRTVGGPRGLRIFDACLGKPALAAFADLAKAEATGISEIAKNALVGVGVGLRLSRSIYGKDSLLRVDFPFYVNRPGPDENGVTEERVAFRWLVSFQPAF